MAKKNRPAQLDQSYEGQMLGGETPVAEQRDIEKNYSMKQFVKKLRRLADCIEQGRRFQIQVAGERVSIPSTAIINIDDPLVRQSTQITIAKKIPIKPIHIPIPNHILPPSTTLLWGPPLISLMVLHPSRSARKIAVRTTLYAPRRSM